MSKLTFQTIGTMVAAFVLGITAMGVGNYFYAGPGMLIGLFICVGIFFWSITYAADNWSKHQQQENKNERVN